MDRSGDAIVSGLLVREKRFVLEKVCSLAFRQSFELWFSATKIVALAFHFRKAQHRHVVSKVGCFRRGNHGTLEGTYKLKIRPGIGAEPH